MFFKDLEQEEIIIEVDGKKSLTEEPTLIEINNIINPSSRERWY